MSRTQKVMAAKMVIEALAVLVIVIVAVAKFEEQIAAINWKLVSLVLTFSVALFGIYRWQLREDNSYDVMDMLMKDGKANLYAHITVASFALAAWLIVQQALEKAPITELMLGVLGIFVAGKAAGGFSDAMQRRPADVSRDTNIMLGATPQPALPQDKPLEVSVVDQAKPIETIEQGGSDGDEAKAKPTKRSGNKTKH